MSGVNQIYAFGVGSNPNTLSNAQYTTALASINNNGYSARSTASSSLTNTTLRQLSVVCAAIAQAIVDVTGNNVLDDGSVTNFESAFLNLLQKPTLGVDSGSTNTYVISLAVPVVAYSDGLQLSFKALNANTGASTINVSTLGSKQLLSTTGAALTGSEIQPNSNVTVVYNSSIVTGGAFVILAATGGANSLGNNSYVPTVAAGDSSNKVSSTAFVQNAIANVIANITLNNNNGLMIKQTTGAVTTVAKIDTSNNIILGGAVQAGNSIQLVNGSTTYLQASASSVTLPSQSISQFDSSGKAATTAYVQSMLGNLQSATIISASTYTIPSYGGFYEYGGATANATWTLPTAAAKGGAKLSFWNNSGYTLTLVSAGSSVFGGFYASNSILLTYGEVLTVTSDGYNWIATSGNGQSYAYNSPKYLGFSNSALSLSNLGYCGGCYVYVGSAGVGNWVAPDPTKVPSGADIAFSNLTGSVLNLTTAYTGGNAPSQGSFGQLANGNSASYVLWPGQRAKFMSDGSNWLLETGTTVFLNTTSNSDIGGYVTIDPKGYKTLHGYCQTNGSTSRTVTLPTLANYGGGNIFTTFNGGIVTGSMSGNILANLALYLGDYTSLFYNCSTQYATFNFMISGY